MSENKDFTEIMQNITSGLTGDSKTDFKYLNSQMEKYKDHELGTEIIRACGRMVYNLLSDEQKGKLEKAAVSDNAGREAALEEVRFNIYKGNWTRAYELIERMVHTLDESSPFQDDQVSEYHTFQEPFEDALFRVMFRPQKTLRQPPINFSEIYYLYGAILVELGKLEEAKTALQTARRWNPVDVKILFEYLDVINREKDYELFYRLTMDALKISFKPESVARCYRNLGFYYVEKELYEAAIACYRISELYDPNTRQVQSELYYISEKMGEPIKQQSSSEIIALSKEYGFPSAPDETILELAVTFGKDAYNAGDYDYAAYFLGIAYGLTRDKGLVEILDDIEKKLSEESDEIEIAVSIDDNNAPTRIPVSEIKNQDSWKVGFDMGYPLWEAGEEARKSGDYEKAISRFDEARALGYLAPVLYKSYSMTYGKLKDVDNEIEILEEGIARLKNATHGDYSTGIKDLETRLEKAKKKKTLH